MALGGCVLPSVEPKTPVVSYQITMPSQDRIRYTGQGVGAGMMLAGSMGPMGVAVGVAMDEGEARKLQQAFADAGYVMQDIISEGIKASALANGVQMRAYLQGQDAFSPELVIYIERYGFQSVQGSATLVQPYLRGRMVYKGRETHLDASSEGQEFSRQLEHLQESGALVAEVFRLLIRSWTEDWTQNNAIFFH